VHTLQITWFALYESCVVVTSVAVAMEWLGLCESIHINSRSG
jgi:hypothetical protein